MNTDSTARADAPTSPLQASEAQAPLSEAYRLLDPLRAVTAPDPYPYYAALTRERPLYYDEKLRLWVVSSARMIEQILNSRDFRVRPLEEPVPKALLGTRAGEIFARLVRMRDGLGHRALKQAAVSTLSQVKSSDIALRSETWMQHLLQAGSPVEPAAGWDGSAPDIACALPLYVLGSPLGVPSDLLPHIVLWMEDFVRALAPGSTPGQIARGSAAAEALTEVFQDLLQQAQFPNHRTPRGMPVNSGLLSCFARSACRHAGHDEATIIANAIGFLMQSYEATAGLIGNTLIALKRNPELRCKLTDQTAKLTEVVRETARHDSPVQNTRRFVAEDIDIAGQTMRAGDAVLLILAAANRDPAVNPEPGRFDPSRFEPSNSGATNSGPSLFTFSAGAHLCPGAAMALAMAEGAVGQVLKAEIDLEHLTAQCRYRPSQNGRIPRLNWPELN